MASVRSAGFGKELQFCQSNVPLLPDHFQRALGFFDLSRLQLPKAFPPAFDVTHDARVRQLCVFVFVYLATYVCGSLVLCACGFNLSDSLFEFASALGTVGISVGVTSAGMPSTALWAETIAMFLGRLEFFVIITSLLKLGKDFRQGR